MCCRQTVVALVQRSPRVVHCSYSSDYLFSIQRLEKRGKVWYRSISTNKTWIRRPSVVILAIGPGFFGLSRGTGKKPGTKLGPARTVSGRARPEARSGLGFFQKIVPWASMSPAWISSGQARHEPSTARHGKARQSTLDSFYRWDWEDAGRWLAASLRAWDAGSLADSLRRWLAESLRRCELRRCTAPLHGCVVPVHDFKFWRGTRLVPLCSFYARLSTVLGIFSKYVTVRRV
jgi:hypothetical protein